MEAGIDPRFQVLDQPQADTLLYELIDRRTPPPAGRARRGGDRPGRAVRPGRLRDMVRQLLAGGRRSTGRNGAARRPPGCWPAGRATGASEALPRAAARIARSPQAAAILGILRDSPPSHPVMRERAAAHCWSNFPRWRPVASGDVLAALAAIRENARVQGGGGKKAWASERSTRRSATRPPSSAS